MKAKNIALALIIMLSSSTMFAQKSEVNTQESNIEWLGKKIGSKHEGTIMLISGSIELKKDQIVAGNFVCDMNSIFGVATYPTAIFMITKSSKFSNGKASVTGDITIKGKTESISFDVVKTRSQYSAKIEIDRSKFDVKYGSNSFFDNLGDKAIDNIFTLTVKLAVK